MRKKTKLILATSILAVGALFISAFALFSADDFEGTNGTAGTVKVDVSNLDLTNNDNINPGDNDPTLNPEGREKGTSHNLTFTVTNEGSKSIRTKQEIIIRLKDNKLDSTVFSLLQLDGKTEVSLKYYEVNGEFITEEKYASLEDPHCTALKYVVASDIFDGVGANAEKETLSTIKTASQSYDYILAMSNKANDTYQAKKIDITVTIYAIQYRNTNASGWYQDISDEDWYEISKQTISGSTP